MDLEPRILNLFEDHLIATQQAIEFVSPAISKSVEYLVQSLVNDGKIYICGAGECSLVAKRFFDTLMYGLERERPALPAYLLTSEQSCSTDNLFQQENESCSHQLRALGQAGDILVVISTNGDSSLLERAVYTAREKGIQVIALTGRDGGALASILTNDDIEIRVPSPSNLRVSEVHWFISHCIVDLVENMLFGTLD